MPRSSSSVGVRVPTRGAARATLLVGVATVLSACASQPAALIPREDPVLARAREVDAAERAPDLWARAEEAAGRAHAQDDAQAVQDYQSEARLWREAAIAEAERIAAEQRRADLEQRVHDTAREVAAVQAERDAAFARAERLAAGILALEEAHRMLEIAAEDKRRRPRLSDAELRDGARALLERARLVAAAARALGAEPEALGQVQARIEAAEKLVVRRPAEALQAADVALFDAHAALGPLRAGLSDDATRSSLHEALHTAGFATSRSERGLLASLPLSGGGRARMLARLCKLRAAFPAGALQLVLRGGNKRGLALLRRELQRAGCDQDSLQWQHLARATDTAVEAVWTAY